MAETTYRQQRIGVDDNASAVYSSLLEQRIAALEQGGMGIDDEGNVVSVAADQVLTSGTEIGGVTIGTTRTAFYAPEVEIPEATKVTVTPLVNSGTKIANIKVNGDLHSIYAPAGEQVVVTPSLNNGTAIGTIKVGNNTTTLYAPEIATDGSGTTVDISGKLDAPAAPGNNGQVLATNGQGVTYWTDNLSGGSEGSTVSVQQIQSTGTKIASITVDGARTDLYAPVGGGDTIITEGGDGPLPLLKTITLNEDVSSIIVGEDESGNELNITEAFYIEADFKNSSTNPAKYFVVSVSGDRTNYANVHQNVTLNTTSSTFADVYAKQIAANRWLVETRSKATKYEVASGLGTGVGQLGYNNWNGHLNPASNIKSIKISYNENTYGKNTVIKIYGR